MQEEGLSTDVSVEIRVTGKAGTFVSQAKAAAWLKDQLPWTLEPKIRSEGSATIVSGDLATENLTKYLNQEGDED